MHIKESHTNGKYAQENHIVLWVCVERREQRGGQKRLPEKVWSSWDPMEESFKKKTRMGRKRVSGWCNSMCNGPVAEGSTLCPRRWKSSKNKTCDVALNCGVREGPDDTVPFRSCEGFLPYPKNNEKLVKGL